MCGFVGGTNSHWRYHAALQQMRHRGPDNMQVVPHEGLTLAFARLAIIDLSSASHQPMQSACGNVTLVFNGEIYEYRALRQRLQDYGVAFRSEGDTEIVLQAYLKWGSEWVHQVDGMFAAGIHDRRDNRLRLYRDHLGIKPLCFYHRGGDFAFASEIKAITALGVATSVDVTAMYDFLSYGYIPHPKSIYREIRQVEPASELVYDTRSNSILSNRRYWSVQTDENSRSDAAAEIKQSIRKSVESQLVADAPVGVFLSGGLDSSAVTAVAATVQPGISAFTIRYECNEKDESDLASAVANKAGVQHHVLTLRRDEATDIRRHLKNWADEPVSTGAVPAFFVSREAHRSIKVALSGAGGDEIFGGYPRFLQLEHQLRLPKQMNSRRLASQLRAAEDSLGNRTLLRRVVRRLRASVTDPVEFYGELSGAMPAHAKECYRAGWGIPNDYDDFWHFRRYWRNDLSPRKRAMFVDLSSYLPDQILREMDLVSMAHSLELRVPLLSKAVVELAYSIPGEQHMCAGELKSMLRTAYRGTLPETVTERRTKQGFSLPGSYAECERGHVWATILNEFCEIESGRSDMNHLMKQIPVSTELAFKR